MDTKKKELIGNFRNQGQAWSREPEEVSQHDFRSEASALAVPYGLYEPVPNLGTIIIGLSADTPEFPVDCLDTWIRQRGWAAYPRMKEILLLCDSGGSNGYRPRFWKYGLYQTIARGHGLTVRVCHYPPGASKWNPVEHRLFSFISLEWAGHPLRSLELMKKYIEGTTTKTGLELHHWPELNTAKCHLIFTQPLRVEYPGYRAFSARMEVVPDRTLHLDIELERLSADAD